MDGTVKLGSSQCFYFSDKVNAIKRCLCSSGIDPMGKEILKGEKGTHWENEIFKNIRGVNPTSKRHSLERSRDRSPIVIGEKVQMKADLWNEERELEGILEEIPDFI